MRIVASFNPATVGQSPSFNAKFGSGPGILIVKNKSFYDLMFTFSDGDTWYCEAGIARLIRKELPRWVISYQVINGSGISTAPPASFPFQTVTVEAYQPSEVIPEIYPLVLPQLWIPNINALIIGGQVFTANTDRHSISAAGNFPLSLFNDGSKTGINVIIVQAYGMYEANNTNVFLKLTTNDPNYGSTPTIIGHDGQATPKANATFTATSQTVPTGNTLRMGCVNTGSIEILQGVPYYLPLVSPSGAFFKSGVTLWNSQNGTPASNGWESDLVWIEL